MPVDSLARRNSDLVILGRQNAFVRGSGSLGRVPPSETAEDLVTQFARDGRLVSSPYRIPDGSRLRRIAVPRQVTHVVVSVPPISRHHVATAECRLKRY